MKKTIIFLSLFTALGSVYYFQPVAYEILKLKTFDSFIQEKQELKCLKIIYLHINQNGMALIYSIPGINLERCLYFHLLMNGIKKSLNMQNQ